MGATPESLADAIAEHLTSLVACDYAPATIAARRAHLRLFATWSMSVGLVTLEDATPQTLEGYRHWLGGCRNGNGAPLSWSTHANRFTGVRMLFAWATRTRRVAMNPAAELRLSRRPIRLPSAVLSISEMERVLSQPNLARPLGIRDRAIMEVLYSTGIRRMELVGLDLVDLDGERGVLFIRQGKGRKDRVVPIGERAVEWIERYLRDVRPRLVLERDSRALFVTRRGSRIRPTRLTDRMHCYIQAAGITKPGSVHVFRHTMATHMHDAGADIRDLQEILGHAHLSTTEIYTRVSIERLKAVHARTHPARGTSSRAIISSDESSPSGSGTRSVNSEGLSSTAGD